MSPMTLPSGCRGIGFALATTHVEFATRSSHPTAWSLGLAFDGRWDFGVGFVGTGIGVSAGIDITPSRYGRLTVGITVRVAQTVLEESEALICFSGCREIPVYPFQMGADVSLLW